MYNIEFVIFTDRPANSVSWRVRRATEMLRAFRFAWESVSVIQPSVAPTKGGIGVYSYEQHDLEADMAVHVFSSADFNGRENVYNFCIKLQGVMNIHGYNLRFAYKEIPDEIFDGILEPTP